MYNIYFDTGTSNTRAYLLKDFEIVDSMKTALGSKDASIAKDNNVLIKGLKETYDKLIAKNSISDEDIARVYASGMVTSPYGICEVPHMSTPVGLYTLCESIYPYLEGNFFKREIFLIRGVKTIPQGCQPTLETIQNVGNLRGEEIEIFGLMNSLKSRHGDIVFFLTGSHTQVVYVKDEKMVDILSEFTGELAHGLTSSTVLSSAIDIDASVIPEHVLTGYKWLEEYGAARALYIIHATKVFGTADNQVRSSLLSGIISGSAVQGFIRMYKDRWSSVGKVVIAGSGDYIRSYEIILKHCLSNMDVETIFQDKKESFSLKGFKEILKREIGR